MVFPRKWSPPPPVPKPPPRCSICGKFTWDGCPNCYLCDVVECRVCYREFHYHCITAWFIDNNGKRVCPNRRIKTYTFNFRRQVPGDDILAYFIVDDVNDVEIIDDDWPVNAGPPPPPPVPRPPPRCSICRNFSVDGCPNCYLCDVVECRVCSREFHYHCITAWVINNNGKRVCPNRRIKTHKFDFRRQVPGDDILAYFIVDDVNDVEIIDDDWPVNAGPPPPPPPVPRPPPRCSICRNFSVDGCPNCYLCDVVECRVCSREFHYHCITAWVINNNGKRVCPNRRIKTHKFDFRRQVPGNDIRACFIVDDVDDGEIIDDEDDWLFSAGLPPPPPSPPPPPMLLPRKKRMFQDSAGSPLPSMLLPRKKRICQDNAGSPPASMLLPRKKRMCQNKAGSSPASMLLPRKSWQCQDSAGSPAPIVLQRKRWKGHVSAGAPAPLPAPPAPAPALPPICSICRYELADICPNCIAKLEANNQHVVVCRAVECSTCRRVFHYDCITQWVISHNGRRDCPIQIINHQFDFRRQRPGKSIRAYFMNV